MGEETVRIRIPRWDLEAIGRMIGVPADDRCADEQGVVLEYTNVELAGLPWVIPDLERGIVWADLEMVAAGVWG